MTGVTRTCALVAVAASSSISTPSPAFLLHPFDIQLSLIHPTILAHRYPFLPHQTLSHTHTHASTMADRPGPGRKGKSRAMDAGATDNKQPRNECSRTQPGKLMSLVPVPTSTEN
jgi:hypothetical protein